MIKLSLQIIIAFATVSTLFAAKNEVSLPSDHALRMERGLKLFQTDVALILKQNCLGCHGGDKVKSDFDLATREDLLRGGAHGSVVVPFDASKSVLIEQINHAKEPHMPDGKPKLSAAVISKITEWINDGAPYAEPLIPGKKPKRDASVVTNEDRQWWAFQPLKKINAKSIDELLLAKARDKGFRFNPPADAAALVRRIYLDLIGMPPTPEELEAGMKDQSATITRLLDSPRYGERWARHWLDVARFAESSGFEHDYDRPFAFHYRDFVIKALNADMPYDQFVKWQLAGDEYEPENPLALAATGFLGAGVFPTQITANEVERTRYDAMDDMLSTTGSAMLGITIGCARCHDHKYDPFPTRDYYAMLSTFTTAVRSNIEVEVDPEKNKALKLPWEAQRKDLETAVSKIESGMKPRFEEWMSGGMTDASKDAWTLIEPTSLKSKAKATFKPLGDGSYLVEGENGAHDVYTITANASQRHITALRVEALAHPSMKNGGPGRAGNGNFGLGKITITASPAKGGPDTEVKIARAVATHEQNKASLSIASSLDENPTSGWAVDGGGLGKDQAGVFIFAEPLDLPEGAKLTIKLEFTVNGQHNIGRPRFSLTSEPNPSVKGSALSAPIAATIDQVRAGKALSSEQSKNLFDWWKQRQTDWASAQGQLTAHLAKEPRNVTTMMICGEGHKPIVMHSQGAPFFEQTHQLKRGNPDLKDGVAEQGFLQVLTRSADTKQWQWKAPEGAKFSGRRRTFSNWIIDVDNGAGHLLARVIVNRLWQHHFGSGIVSTSTDFGKTGSPPSQPELLDWLAGELIRNGWKLKPIHKLIMTSAAYQQSCAHDTAKETADPANGLFMRRVPQRLEAEVIRDSMLAVSGMLDETMFGSGTRDENNKRRSIYFNIKRSQLIGSMVAFDAPEPLVSQGVRPTTTVAPQALMLMNSPQARAWAEGLAKRIPEAGDVKKQIAQAYKICFSRSPTSAELTQGTTFLQQGGSLADYCQVLLSLNEFVYVN
jgi:mono/diheme cytochrome c family protein